jgi:PhnB protein
MASKKKPMTGTSKTAGKSAPKSKPQSKPQPKPNAKPAANPRKPAAPAKKSKSQPSAPAKPKAKNVVLPRTKPSSGAVKSGAQKKRASAIPERYRTVTPRLCVRNADAAITFYKAAFGAKEHGRVTAPNGGIVHAMLTIGDSVVHLQEEMPGQECMVQSPQGLSGATASIDLYVKDCDASHARAIEAGATATMPVSDLFWGDRGGALVDPYGHHWFIMTHKRDMTARQINQAAEEFFRQMQEQAQSQPQPQPEAV